MPKWVHDRADHIREKNPSMPKSESFAIATNQAKAAGKFKAKHSSTHEAFLSGLMDELQKIAGATTLSTVTKPMNRMGTLTKKPAMTSKPVTREPDPPAATLDHFSSSRTMQPPPVTSAGGL